MRYSILCLAFLTTAILLPSLALAADFDVETATRGYLDQLQGEERERSDRYFEGGYWLPIWGTLIAVLVDGLFLKFRWSARIRDFAERITKWRWLQPAIYAAPYTIIGTLITVPWTIYTDFFREKTYGFVNQSFGAWAGEQAIGLVIGIIVISIFLMILFAVIRRMPKNWWILGTITTSLLLIFFVLVSPVYIAPIFNDYTELEDGQLKSDIIAMAQAYDVPADKIYVFNQSKQHDRISANVSGFANTMRISLNDNLLNKGTPEEIKAVMGHELGHYVKGHIWRIILIMSLLLGIGFFLISRLVPKLIAKHGERWGVRSVSDIAALPLFGIILAIYSFAITPITNSLIRINESEADLFGLEAANEPDGFASIAMKLSAYRKIEPGPIEEIIFFDHPSGETRVRMAMEWKAKNLPD